MLLWSGVRRVVLVSVFVSVGSCARPDPHSAEGSGEGAVTHRRFGDLMSEVGRRFERSGRAVAAGRWELAAYDIDEINEVFNGDVPTAEMPAEVHVDLRPLARAFASAHPPALARAIASHDRAAFTAAFAQAAATCNGCHLAAGKGYIEIPSVIGAAVPSTEPMQAAPAVPTAPAGDASTHP